LFQHLFIEYQNCVLETTLNLITEKTGQGILNQICLPPYTYQAADINFQRYPPLSL